MKSREQFFENSYSRIKSAIEGLKGVNDIYALSFFYYCEDDDLRFPVIEVSYNTNQKVKDETKNASSRSEAKWNFAFWFQDGIITIGGESDKLLANWFRDSPYYYLAEENEEADEDNKQLFNKILKQGGLFCNEFVDGIIFLVQRLFNEKVIERVFGQEIPIVIHELEYYDEPIGWTRKANPEILIQEFLEAYKNGDI